MTRWVRNLLIANVLVFFVQYTMPGWEGPFIFVPRSALFRPWSIITYMFLHAGIGHIFFNMLALFFFGPRVESRLGSNRFIQLYLVSGISGALLSVGFAPYTGILGASAAVFGVMLAYAMFWPRDQILIWGIIPMEVRWLVILTTGFAIWSGLNGSQSGVADFAHLGGYLGAWVFLRFIDPAKRVARFKASTIAVAPGDKLSNWKRVNVASVHEVNRDELNRILDKINHTGLTSLSAEERLFLSNFVPPDDRPPVH